MKINNLLKGMLLVSGVMVAGAVMAEEPAETGKKIYERAMGRGCGACHDNASFPDLFKSVNTLSRDDLKGVLVNGRNTMPKVMDAIMGVGPVKSAGLTEDQAVDALIAYLKQGR